ncbi:hypothetical protein KKF38_01255 [Patescibacteria group bacterium]|nr:hypothetical protein [Patescibacteria group bacterium]
MKNPLVVFAWLAFVALVVFLGLIGLPQENKNKEEVLLSFEFYAKDGVEISKEVKKIEPVVWTVIPEGTQQVQLAVELRQPKLESVFYFVRLNLDETEMQVIPRNDGVYLAKIKKLYNLLFVRMCDE